MKRDEQNSVIKGDDLLQHLAFKLLQRVLHNKHHSNYILNTLGQLAELLIDIRLTKPDVSNANMRTILNPKYFRYVLQSFRNIAGHDSGNLKCFLLIKKMS